MVEVDITNLDDEGTSTVAATSKRKWERVPQVSILRPGILLEKAG